jgi:serine/threonine protein kinase
MTLPDPPRASDDPDATPSPDTVTGNVPAAPDPLAPTATANTPASDPTRTGGTAEAAELPPFDPPRDPAHLGRLDHYEILGVLGQGGMGVVLKAHDEALNRVVAIKVLAPRLAVSPVARKRFIREARAVAAVTHDNVVAVHAVVEQSPYLVMQYIAGLSLQQCLEAGGPLPVETVVRVGAEIAAGLAAAHAQGLVHRDIKPSNVLLEPGTERVKITDFGLARAVDDEAVTQSGAIMGTPLYMSPEQARGDLLDARSDLFSLGSVLYALCSGASPFRASGMMAVLRRVIEDDPRPLVEVNPTIPLWLSRIVHRLLAKDPDNRYQSADNVARLLTGHLAHLRDPARHALPSAATDDAFPPPPPDDPPAATAAAWTPRRKDPKLPAGSRRWTRIVAAVAFLLFVAAGATFGLIAYFHPEPTPVLLSIPVADYEQWPANPWAKQDSEGLLASLPGPDSGLIPTQAQSQEGDLEREIDRLADMTRKAKGRPVVVHLSALAVADGTAVYVLQSKASVARRDLWVPLDNILKAVARIGGDRLLLLDLRPVAGPRVGQMGNELAMALHMTLATHETAGQLPFLVAAYCAPAEYPYVSPELGRGVFAEFLRMGLSGWADGFSGEADRRVSAVELATFARAWVIHWLKKHEVPVAAPVLYGTGKDFVIRHVSPDPLPWPTPKPAPGRPQDLWKAWQTVDDWRAGGAGHKFPRTFRQLQETVVGIDQAAAGGGSWDSLQVNLQAQLLALHKQQTALEPGRYPVATVGRLERLAKQKTLESTLRAMEASPAKAEPKSGAKGREVAAELQRLRDALKQANRAAGTKEKPGDKKESDEAKVGLDKAIAAFVAAPPELPPYEDTVLELFRDLMSADGAGRGRGNLEQYLKVFRDLPNPPTHLELAYLALVADPTPEGRQQWPAELPQVLLSAAVAGEEATAVGGRGLVRITAKQPTEPSLEFVEAKFADALKDVLSSPGVNRWRASAKAFGEVETMYRKLAPLGAAHAAAVWGWEEDIALLVAIWDYSPQTKAAGGDGFENRWKKLLGTTDSLRRAIELRAGANELTIATDESRRARSEVEKGLQPLPGVDPVEVRARLRLPLWQLEDRQRWTAEADAAAVALAAVALAERSVRPEGDVRKPYPEDPFDIPSRRRAIRSRGILALVESNPPAEGMTGWRAAFADRLIARYQAAESKPVLDRTAEREKFAWLIHPADLPATPDAGNPRADPAAEHRIESDRAAAQWLLEHRYGRLVREIQKLPDRPPAAMRLAEALTKAIQSLSGWPR